MTVPENILLQKKHWLRLTIECVVQLVGPGDATSTNNTAQWTQWYVNSRQRQTRFNKCIGLPTEAPKGNCRSVAGTERHETSQDRQTDDMTMLNSFYSGQVWRKYRKAVRYKSGAGTTDPGWFFHLFSLSTVYLQLSTHPLGYTIDPEVKTAKYGIGTWRWGSVAGLERRGTACR